MQIKARGVPLPEERPWMRLEEAGECFGISRYLSYELAKKGEFPVAVLRVGRLYRVPTAEVRRKLGLGGAA